MKEKLKITEENYKEIMLKRSIILCWVLLAICFVIKIFGGNFFEIVCTNEKFINVCEFIDNSILYYIFSYMSYIITSLLLIIIIRDNKKIITKGSIIYLICCSLYWGFKLLIQFNIVKLPLVLYNILEYGVLYLLLIIFSKKYIKSIFVIIAMVVFSILSVITKNIGISGTIGDSSLIAIIFMIDYYIMLILCYLYSIKIKNKKRSV